MEQFRELLAKFWKGTATSDERKQLLHLIRKQEPEIKTTNWIDFQKQTEEPQEPVLQRKNRKKILDKIHKQLAASSEPNVIKPETSKPFLKRLFPIVRIAAAALIIVSLGVIIAVKQLQIHATEEMAATDRKTIVHQNKTMTMLSVMLPDSSKIHLAPGSTVEYQSDFNDSHRELSLTGNARFKVTKNPTRPFRVTSRGYTVTALGTIFVINAAEENRMQVLLLEGKVGVSEASHHQVDQHVLYPGEELLIDFQHKHINKFSTSTHSDKAAATQSSYHKPKPNVAGQKKVVLHFSETPFSTVIEQLEALYNKKIIYADMQDSEKTYSGSLSLGDGSNIDSLRETLHLLFKNTAMNYRIEPDRVVITKQEPQKQ